MEVFIAPRHPLTIVGFPTNANWFGEVAGDAAPLPDYAGQRQIPASLESAMNSLAPGQEHVDCDTPAEAQAYRTPEVETGIRDCCSGRPGLGGTGAKARHDPRWRGTRQSCHLIGRKTIFDLGTQWKTPRSRHRPRFALR